MKNTTNVFLKGMTSDMHPLTTSQLEYTDALNATLVTFNGNEQMMLNDMGNTKIQDSKTGNLMGLREGFIPVGLKEHGGIMYIASVNKEGEGEIGTIPSPVIRYNKKDEFDLGSVDTSDPLNTNKILALNMDPNKGYGDLVKLTEYPLKAGDKFVVFLPLDNTSSGDASFNCPDSNNLITTPIIENNTNQGIYRIGLYSQADGQVYDLNDLVDGLSFSFLLRDTLNNPVTLSNRWFVDLSDLTLDVDAALVNENSETRGNSSFIMYPRISSGYPSIRLEINRLDSFSLLPNHTSTTDDNRRYPFTIFDDSDPNNLKYITFIRGFEYTTSSGIHPTKLKISLINDTTGEFVKIFNIEDENSDSDDSLLDEQIEYLNNKEYTLDIDAYRYCISPNSELRKFNISFIEGDDYNNLKNSYYDNSDNWTNGIALDIGSDSNVWFTLTVDYYYTDNGTDIKLGTYTCRYNPYVYDTLKNFRQIKYIVNENYNGEGNTWFLLYYDVKLRYATNIEKTFSKLFISKGNPNSYPNPSGCSVNQIEVEMEEPDDGAGHFGTHSIPIVMWGYPTSGDGLTDISDKSTSDLNTAYAFKKDSNYRCFFKRENEEAEASFYRSGVRMSHLGLSLSDITNITNIKSFGENTGDPEKYLYVNPIIKEFDNDDILLSYNFNNLGFRIAGDDFATGNADWDDDVLIYLQCLPLYKSYKLERKIHRVESDDINYPEASSPGKDAICIFAPQNSFISQLSKLEFSEFKDYLENNWPIFVLKGYTSTDSADNYSQEIFWLSRDPDQIKDGYSNDSVLTLDINLSRKLNITGISDYQVVPQINVVYEEDGQIYPGYYNSDINSVEEIDLDITRNYFLKNGISEGSYILNAPYHSFEDTSIYGSGFGYHKFSSSDNLNIFLEKGTYAVNFNCIKNDDNSDEGGDIEFTFLDKNKLKINNISQYITWVSSFSESSSEQDQEQDQGQDHHGIPFVNPDPEFEVDIPNIPNNTNLHILSETRIAVFEVKLPVILNSVTVLTTRKDNLNTFNNYINFTSCGLYKVKSGYNINNVPKLQTVYTYSEEKIEEDENHNPILIPNQCLGKEYKYKGGAAFCGYLKSEGTYIVDDLEDNKITYNDTEIEVRRCLAPQ